jgi:hypothetical protein
MAGTTITAIHFSTANGFLRHAVLFAPRVTDHEHEHDREVEPIEGQISSPVHNECGALRQGGLSCPIPSQTRASNQPGLATSQ